MKLKRLALIRMVFCAAGFGVAGGFVSTSAQAYDWRNEWEERRTEQSFGPQPVFADHARLYAAPSEEAATVLALPAGTPIVLHGPFRPESPIHGHISNFDWWWASHTDETGKTHKGYVHHEIFASTRADFGEQRFLLGWTTAYTETGLRTLTLKVFDGSRQVAREDIPLDAAMSGHSMQIQEVHSLQGLSAIVRLGIGAEQCGYPYLGYLYGWTGTTLRPLPTLVSNGGEGVDPSYSMSMTIPEASPDTLIKLVRRDTPAYAESELTPASAERTDYATVVYEWDGRHAVVRTQDASLLDGIRDPRPVYYVDDTGTVIRNDPITGVIENNRP